MTLCWLHYRKEAIHVFFHDGERKPPRRCSIFMYTNCLCHSYTTIKIYLDLAGKTGDEYTPKAHQVITWFNGSLPDTPNCRLCMRRECRERFLRHRFQRKPLVNDLNIHHGTCVTHVPWCMSGSLTHGGWKNLVPGIPWACTARNFAYLVSGPCQARFTRNLMAH